jgi:hypothetical protein
MLSTVRSKKKCVRKRGVVAAFCWSIACDENAVLRSCARKRLYGGCVVRF